MDIPNIDLSKIKKEHLALACIILVAAIAFFAYRNIFSPLLDRIKEASAEVQELEVDIQKARISPVALKKLEDEVGEIKTRANYYSRKLASKVDVPQILKELNQIAERLNIKFVSVKPLERKKAMLPGSEEFLLLTPITIKLQCGYHQLGIFINQIENSPRLMKISTLKITANARNIWEHQVELAITSYNLVSK